MRKKFAAAFIAMTLFTACDLDFMKGRDIPAAPAAETIPLTAEDIYTEGSLPETFRTEITSDVFPAAEDDGFAYVSPDNVFVDFDYIECCESTDISSLGTLGAKAAEFLAESAYYAESEKQIALFSDEAFKHYFDEGGNILPKLRDAYSYDYDGDGKNETFILLNMPYAEYGYPYEAGFLIFADSDENMTLLDIYTDCRVDMLDYGTFRQIIVGADSRGASGHNNIYGVSEGQPVRLYNGFGYYEKFGCFLSSYDGMGYGGFMYYDIPAGEYRFIVGEDIGLDDMRLLDGDGILPESVYDDFINGGGLYSFQLVGKRYFIKTDLNTRSDVIFMVENGKLTHSEECSRVRSSRCDDEANADIGIVRDIDINKALEDMISAEEMRTGMKKVLSRPEGRVFIDYSFIYDYWSGAADASLREAAVRFLTESGAYADNCENIMSFTGEAFREEFGDMIDRYTDSSGNIVPEFRAAYPEDYDGDGKTETFILVDMPYALGGYAAERSYLIFADSSGNMTLLNDFSGLYPVSLLNYGCFRQIIFGGSGIVGADERTVLYGVRDGQAEVLYDDEGYSEDFRFVKSACFLSASAFRGGNDFMWFDTGSGKYRVIGGETVSADTVRAMDKDGVLADYFSGDDSGGLDIQLVGKRYYLLRRGGIGSGMAYIYRNGRFVWTSDCGGVSFSENKRGLERADDINIEEALNGMLTPAEAKELGIK